MLPKQQNSANFSIGESPEVREVRRHANQQKWTPFSVAPPPPPPLSLTHTQEFCSVVLSQLTEKAWSNEVAALSLTALKIFAREQAGTERLKSGEGLKVLLQLAGLDREYSEGWAVPEEGVLTGM